MSVSVEEQLQVGRPDGRGPQRSRDLERAEGGAGSDEPLSAASLTADLTDAARASVAVIIPCYRCRDQILHVLKKVGAEVSRIFVVDDACPQQSGDCVKSACNDPRVTVIRHDENQCVGGAMITGDQT